MQAERGVAKKKAGDVWLKDDGLATYSSQEQAEYVGRWQRMRVEFRARQIKGHLLSTVLIRVKDRMNQALREKTARQSASQFKTAKVPQQATLDAGTGREKAETLKESATNGASQESQGPRHDETRVAVESSDAATREPTNTMEQENEEDDENREEEVNDTFSGTSLMLTMVRTKIILRLYLKYSDGGQHSISNKPGRKCYRGF